jgi:hypothetical protein
MDTANNAKSAKGVFRDRIETTGDQAMSGILRLLPVLAMQPKNVMCLLPTIAAAV